MANLDPTPADRGPNDFTQKIDNIAQVFKDLTGEFSDNEKEKYSNWNLKYPSTIESGQDRIIINQLQYIPSLNVTDSGSSTFRGESQFRENNGETRKEKLIGSVVLPMPNDISESNSVGWGEDSLSNIAAMAMPGLIKLGGGIAGLDGETTAGGIDALKKAVTSGSLGTRANQYLATNFAASVVKKIGINVNPEAYITRATGTAVNPNMELLFNGPKLRQFGLAFKMTPRSEAEAKSIRGIIQFFKKGMSPRRSNKDEFSFFLGTPNVFQVKFMSGNKELKSIGRFKTCALVSFSVNYTADGFYAAYQDSLAGGSQPISVSMQMAFTELTPVYSDEFDLDDSAVTLGPSKFNDTYDSRIGKSESDSPQSNQPLTPDQIRQRSQINPLGGIAGSSPSLNQGNPSL